MTSTTRTYTVPGMSCDHCVTAITDHVQPLDGVERVAIDLGAKTVTVVGGDDETIVAAID
ncbi:MAG: cation transporter [Actinomycetota bacterium]